MSGTIVARHPRADDAHVDAGNAGGHPLLPLAQRQVGYFMALLGEALGEVAIPPLGPADRVGIQTVIDEADPHADPESLISSMTGSHRRPHGHISWETREDSVGGMPSPGSLLSTRPGRHEHTPAAYVTWPTERGRRPLGLGRHPLPQRGRVDPTVRHPGARCSQRERHCRRSHRRRQRFR